jgi:uroporphyrinogen decarboxylase
LNSKERIMAVLNLEKPDRIPVGEMVIDNKVIAGFDRGYKDVVDFALGEGLDLVGAMANFDVVDVFEDSTYVDEWGCRYKSSENAVDHPIEGPIKSEEDLDAYEPPDPNGKNRLGNLCELVEKAQGKLAINFHCRVAFMWSVFLMGMDNLLVAMALNPKLVHRLFATVAEVNIETIRRAVRAGADTISLGDDYCSNRGPLMSPAMFKEFIFPHLKRAVEVIHEEGAKCIKHTDGNIWPILNLLVEAGIDCINPIEPVAGMKVDEIKSVYGDRICMMGNIDCGDLLINGTTNDVEYAVETCIKEGASGGGLIISSSNSVHAGVTSKNYAAMIRAVQQYGIY